MRKIEKMIIENRSSDNFITIKEMKKNWSGNIYELKNLSYSDLFYCLSKINEETTQLIKVRNKYYMWYFSPYYY